MKYGHCFSTCFIIEETSGKQYIVKVLEPQFQPRSFCYWASPGREGYFPANGLKQRVFAKYDLTNSSSFHVLSGWTIDDNLVEITKEM